MAITGMLVDEEMFERMRDYNADYAEMTFDKFSEWNKACVVTLSEDDRIFVTGLCKRIRQNKLSMMDGEGCGIFNASGIFFDKKMNVCVVNPR